MLQYRIKATCKTDEVVQEHVILHEDNNYSIILKDISQNMKIFAISLGCAKNSIDTELILGSLVPAGARLVNRPEVADVILVNTCGFLESAVQESIDSILEMAEHRTRGQILAVTGCMVERYGLELRQELPEVDIFHGTVRPELMAEKIEAKLHAMPGKASVITGPSNVSPKDSAHSRDACGEWITAGGRLVTTPPWRAFVRIAEGCSNRCTYCLIPSIRGKNICRPADEIINEIRQLSAAGIREITLLAQDLTSYRHGRTDLAGLAHTIMEETDIPWLRLLYLHPGGLTAELLQVMAENDTRICPYLDIPVQHAASGILKRMGRGYDAKYLERLFTMTRDTLPHAALRTTVMVGFPGESEADFQQLMEFINRYQFMHLGCFVYSDEEESAAHGLDGKVDAETADARKAQIMEAQAGISQAINRRLVGKTLKVLVEGISEETDLLLQGRTMLQAPEVDGITYIAEGTANPGDMVDVTITDSHIYDLVGGIAEQKE